MSFEIELIKIIKRAAMEAVEAQKPMACVCGKVVSTLPMVIRIEPGINLESEHLILTDLVSDHTVVHTSIDEIPPKTYRFIEHSALSAGEEVIMLRCQGGQKYIVLCRKEAKQ